MKPAQDVEAPTTRLLSVDAMAPTRVETATFALG
jgi:hypothetical protein